jgi:hypothetical protein
MQEKTTIPAHQEVLKKILAAHNKSYDAVYEILKPYDLDPKEFNDLVGLVFEIRSFNYLDEYDHRTLQRILDKLVEINSLDTVGNEGLRNKTRISLVMNKKPSGRSI